MSTEEDTELRDLLAQTLEGNGSLAKIRAQLRASVFLAFDENELLQKKQPLLNTKINRHTQTPEGQLMFCVVREFLEFFNLNYTISVFEPESYLGSKYDYEGRSELLKDLDLENVNESVPILLQLIRLAQENKKTGINGTFVVGKDDERNGTPRSDDTYEGTSSIAEDSIKEKTANETPKTLLDSPPILKDKPKSPKLKSKLSDFPPLQFNKFRHNNDNFDNDYEEDFNSDLDGKSDKSLKLTNMYLKQSGRVNAADSLASSITSEDFDLNSSNIDDILNSKDSN